MTLDESLKLWTEAPPQKHWLKLELGIDGWVVQAVTHGEHQKDIKVVFKTDDYGPCPSLSFAIEEAYRAAVAGECWEP
jgi:glycosidase